MSEKLKSSGWTREKRVEMAKEWLKPGGQYHSLVQFDVRISEWLVSRLTHFSPFFYHWIPITQHTAPRTTSTSSSLPWRLSSSPSWPTRRTTVSYHLHWNFSLIISSGKNEFAVIFKTGDDLRQDQLVVQLFSLMDRLLKKENLNLNIITYKVLSLIALRI